MQQFIYISILFSIFFTSFSSFSEPLKVLQFREIQYQNTPALRVRLSQALDVDSIERNLILTETTSGDELQSWIIEPGNKSLLFPFVKPSTKYHLAVGLGLKSDVGNRLKKSYQNTLTTKRLRSVARFSSSGLLLNNTNNRSLPVTLVNVADVDIDVYKVKQHKHAEFIQSRIKPGTNYGYQLSKLKNMAQMVHSGRFKFQVNDNQKTQVNVDLSDIDTFETPGVYVAVLSGAGNYENNYSVMYFTISDLAIQARKFEQKMVVNVSNLNSGNIEENSFVIAYGNNAQVLFQSHTDELGNVEFYANKKVVLITADKGNKTSILPIVNKALDLSDFQNPTTVHSDTQVYSFGPRDLFRPGEKAVVQILLRDHDGMQMSDVPLNVELKRPDGQVATQQVLQPLVAGYYLFEYQLPENSVTGNWSVNYKFKGEQLIHKYTFKVEEFKPNQLALDLFVSHANIHENGDKRLSLSSAEITNTVEGKYLFGAPANGNKVDAIVNWKFDRHPFVEYKNYYFGNELEKLKRPKSVIRAIKLDANGIGTLSTANRFASHTSPLLVNYAVSLYESGGRPVVNKGSITLLNSNGFIGIKPLFSEEPAKNSSVNFDVISLTKQLKVKGNQELTVSLIAEDRNYYWTYNDHRGWSLEYDDSPYEAWSGKVTSDENGLSHISVPLEYGHYVLRVSNSNDKVVSTYSFKTAGRWWSNSSETKNKPQTVLMDFEQSQYQVNQQANLNFVSPHAGTALITVESNDGILLQEQMKVKEGETTYRFDIKNAWNRHDIYATVTIVSQKDNHHLVKRAFGFTHLPIEREHFKLGLTVEAESKAKPMQPVHIKIKADNAELIKSDTYVTVALVDVGILNITKHKSPKPEDYFLAPRRYQVELYDIYDKLIKLNDGITQRQLFGGDFLDSDEELSRGGRKITREDELVSLLSQPVQLDENREATISFTLPDYVGKLRWNVVAFNDVQMGSSEIFTTVSSPIVSQLATPDFLNHGDKSLLTLDLHNQTDEPQTLQVTLETTSGILSENLNKTVTLPSKGKQTIYHDIEAGKSSNKGMITYDIKQLEADDPLYISKQKSLSVVSPYPAQTLMEHFQIKQDQLWHSSLDYSIFQAESIQGQLTLSPTPPINLHQHFSYMLKYPYGCLEQTISKARAWLITTPTLADKLQLDDVVALNSNKQYSAELRKEMLEASLDRMMQKQRSSGAFSLWSKDGPENPWLTVHAAEFMVDSAKAGIQVSNSSLNKVLNVLKRYVRRDSSVQASYWLTSQNDYKIAVRSYASYVLAKANKLSLSDLRRLYNQVKHIKEVSTLSKLHLASAFRLLGANNDAKNIASTIEQFQRPTGYIGDYGNSVRDLAWVIHLTEQHKFDLTFDLYQLDREIKSRRWLSTQDRSHLLKLASSLSNQVLAFSADLNFNDGSETLALADKTRFNSLLTHAHLSKLQSIKLNSDSLYGTLAINGELTKQPDVKDDVINIERDFYDVNGYEVNLSDVNTSQLVLVKLMITASKNMPDGLVIEKIPAGFMLENQNLSAASVDINSIAIEGKTIKLNNSAIQHQEYRQDRYVAAIELRNHRTETLYYLARAVTPGEYTLPPTIVEDMFQPEDYGVGESGQVIIKTPQVTDLNFKEILEKELPSVYIQPPSLTGDTVHSNSD